VIEDVRKKHACACTAKTATKPPQPIEKSTAGASLLAQVVAPKTVDHLPLHRQEKIFERHGVEISRQTMCGWLVGCADLLRPFYGSLKETLFQSKVIGTDDTNGKVLVAKLPFARTGRIWPYYGCQEHPVIAYGLHCDAGAGRAREVSRRIPGLLTTRCLQRARCIFQGPGARVDGGGCRAHARRYFHRALESDQGRMGPALLLVAQLYRVESLARGPTAERDTSSAPLTIAIHSR
jgi:hypothetical protein